MELIDAAVLAKDSVLVQHILTHTTDNVTLLKAGSLALDLTNGAYLKIIKQFDGTVLDNVALLEYLSTDDHDDFTTIHDKVLSYITTEQENTTRVSRTFETLMLGVAYFELYCQSNYTGPELAPALLEVFTESTSRPITISSLECDGTYAFRTIEIPQTLLIARIILGTLADPLEACWREGVALDATGGIRKKEFRSQDERLAGETLIAERAVLRSVHWWSARAAVVHLRLLQKQSYEDVPTLWREVQSRFQQALQTFTGLPQSQDLVEATKPPKEYREEGEAPQVEFSIKGLRPQVRYNHSGVVPAGGGVASWAAVQKQLATQTWLEWGLCCLHFGFGDKGKKSFAFSQETAGLHTEMLASMGKRTKHQHSEYAQLFLYAKSSLIEAPTATSTTSTTEAAVENTKPAEGTGAAILAPATNPDTVYGVDPANPQGWQHSEWEMGRRMVREVEGGEEVAVREVLLDSMDGGAVENIILEGGPKFSATASGAVDKGGDLHPIDQAIILALCLDVGNSNPVDGLTNEEMQPYVERVLELAANWMIHSTSLLERSWLEFERRKTMDRAMLQIQALIDQHTTKLTLLQSTYKCVEDSAPVQDRMKYLFSIVYPAQYELKRDLAMRYLRCQVFVSALNYFRELEMWDEVVTCYQLLDKPHRAELVVREQLAKSGETPYMLTSLADLTRKEEYYEKAWTLSKNRYPRAKRTLGKICYDRGDFEACVTHMDAALAVHPLVATAWYLRGLACMRLERWDDAIQSFVRCVQQDMEIGEAWANIGAINMRLRAWPKAYEALNEAMRHKQDNWRIMENLMTVAIALGRWRDVIRFMTRLLDLRLKSERPVHKDELRHLCFIVAGQAQREAKAKAKTAAIAASTGAAVPAAEPAAETGRPPLPPSQIAQQPPIPATVLAALRAALEELDQEFDGDDITDQQEVSPLPDLVVSTEKLLTSITNAIRSDAEIWDIFADFQHKLGRYRLALDCRNKQFRGLTSEDAWEKVPAKITAIAEAGRALARALHFQDVKKADIYSVRNSLQTALRRFENNTFESPEEKATLEGLITMLNTIYASL